MYPRLIAHDGQRPYTVSSAMVYDACGFQRFAASLLLRRARQGLFVAAVRAFFSRSNTNSKLREIIELAQSLSYIRFLLSEKSEIYQLENGKFMCKAPE